MDLKNIKKRYSEAVNSFILKVKNDANVIAVILCGSLSYDSVWKKSDVDMVLIVRDQKLINKSLSIVEDDIIINVYLIERSKFRREMEWNIGGSQMHSYYSKGQIIYSADDSLYDYFKEIKKLGRDDMELFAFSTSGELIDLLHKSEKWLLVKNDLLYSQYYILKAAYIVAKIEVCLNGEIPTRESILRAREINPELMSSLYDESLSHSLNKEQLLLAIKKIDEYLEANIEIISNPVIKFMNDGTPKTVTVLSKHFKLDSHYIVEILEYLSHKGIIEKLSETIRITPKSRPAVEELAYIYLGNSF